MNYLKFLPLEEQIKIKNEIEKQGTEEFSKMTCMICLGTIAIPVELSRPLIHCNDCGPENTGICCLGCVRDWLQLNKNKNERISRTHLICRKPINTSLLNAKSSYKVLTELIDNLDKFAPKIMNCICGNSFTKRKLYYHHIGDGTCQASTWYCKYCNFVGKTAEYIRHTTKNSNEGGCNGINIIIEKKLKNEKKILMKVINIEKQNLEIKKININSITLDLEKERNNLIKIRQEFENEKKQFYRLQSNLPLAEASNQINSNYIALCKPIDKTEIDSFLPFNLYQ